MRYIFILAIGIMTGCTPLITSTIQLQCGDGKFSQTNKADTDQTPSTDMAIPVSVGAQPISNGTAN